MAISKKMLDFEKSSSWIRKMFEEGAKLKAQYGPDNVCDFSLGNPDLSPPLEFHEIIQKMVLEESPGIHGYMPNSGYQSVRDAVAKQISMEQDITLSHEELLMTCGAAGGLNVIMKSLLNSGDEVIILAPFFVEYNFYVDNHNGVPKVVKTASDFSLDFNAIEQALSEKTKAIIINSPNNPTGQIYSSEDLKRLGEILNNASSTIYLISDEPYRKIVYDKYQVPSVFNAYTNSIVVSSYSKDLSLAGERIGYTAVHPDIEDKDSLICAMTLANRILGFVNAPGIMQRVVGKLQGVVVDCDIYAKRRDLFCEILTDAGYEFVTPKGAFYLFPKSPIPDDAEFIRCLSEQKILAVPGRGFGMPGYFRLAFCVEDNVIERSGDGFKKAIEESIIT